MKSTNAATTIQALDEIFQIHGLPISIKSDSGPAFKSKEFEQFCQNLGIAHSRGTPRWPQNNGLAESCMKSIKKRLQIATATGANWRGELQKYLFSYRNTPHAATGKSPAELLFGRKLRTKLPMLLPEVEDIGMRDNDAMHKAKSKMYADKKRNAVESNIEIGDEVLLQRDQVLNKTDTRFYADPFTAVDKVGSQVTVQASDGENS